MAVPVRRLVGVQTKMYLSHAQTQAYLDALTTTLSKTPSLASQVDFFLLVDHISLAAVASQWKASPHHGALRLRIGAQDTSPEDRGAFTGQVSAAVLAEVGCEIVMVGHAERRRIFGEDDGLVARKAAAAARNGMVPLVCVGEVTRPEAGGVEAAVAACRAQIETVVAAVPEEAEVVLAYEPVWAIGAEEPAAAEYVVAVARGIKRLECVRARRGLVRIVYGGSAGPGMFEGVKDGVDGLFMARFGLDVGAVGRVAGEVASA
ncbi:triosephosphate isomerase [Colletotrichum tofieldiae]|nr:triosephosphate isomerase [Colletotrichum tofieldiae]GKT79691.1 triosephosphate isomerase [Colletotrichum tofieldiae]